MRHWTLPIIFSLTLAVPAAQAGRNQNGALVVHVDDSIEYSGVYYCQTPTLPSTCEELNANGTQGIVREQIVWLLAAFLPEQSPAVTAIQFGIEHNLPANQGYFTNFMVCGPSPIELPDAGWPETGLGNVIAYGSPVYEHVFRFYWFALLRDGPDNYFGTRTYPSTNQAKFVDDGSPPFEDLCINFGTLRWDGGGHNDCPQHGEFGGACCFCDGGCTPMWPGECEALGGTYQGTGVPCDPNPCPPSMGACCLQDGRCVIVACSQECTQLGGDFHGYGSVCDPNPCPQFPMACCFPDGSCTYIPAQQCEADGGISQGLNTDCDPNLCPPTALGACCIDMNGTCWIMTEADCTQQGGVYQGDDTRCDPNPCYGFPIEPTTWGRIKATYR